VKTSSFFSETGSVLAKSAFDQKRSIKCKANCESRTVAFREREAVRGQQHATPVHKSKRRELNVSWAVVNGRPSSLAKGHHVGHVISLSSRNAVLLVYGIRRMNHARAYRPLSNCLSHRRWCRPSAHSQSKVEHGLHVTIRGIGCSGNAGGVGLAGGRISQHYGARLILRKDK
jgi:hypothetical protein